MKLLAKNRTKNYPINLVVKLDKSNSVFHQINLKKSLKWRDDLI